MSARVDDLLRDLRVELEHATPSAGFRQRVHAHALANGRVRRARLVVPAALAAAAALFLTARSMTPVSEPSPLPPTQQVPTVPSSVALAPVTPPAATPVRVRQQAPGVARLSKQPEVLVPPDEELALRRWLAHLRGPRAPEVATLVPLIALVEIPLIQIEPIPAGQAGGERNR
jgi:hypothetical protein